MKVPGILRTNARLQDEKSKVKDHVKKYMFLVDEV